MSDARLIEAERLLRAAYADAHSEDVPADVLAWLNPEMTDPNMSEQITITVSLEQAEALIDAATCLASAADGMLAELVAAYARDGRPVAAEADRMRQLIADHAMAAVDPLRKEIKDAYARDPEMMDAIHAIKMAMKRPLGQ